MNATEERLPPLRGIVCCANRRGKPFSLTALKQWLHLSQAGYKAAKVDLLVETLPHADVCSLLDYALEIGLPCSVRLGCAPTLKQLRDYAAREALDVFYAPTELCLESLNEVATNATACGLPLRIQFTAPHLPHDLPMAARQAVSINLAAHDPFIPVRPMPNPDATIRQLAECAAQLKGVAAEVNILRLPFCQLPEELWPETLTGHQFFLHHQQYLYECYDLATTIFDASPTGMAASIEHQISASANFFHVIDKHAFPRIISHPRLHARLWLLNKLRRKLPRSNALQQPLPENADSWEAALAERKRAMQRALGPACAACALRRICDHAAPPFRALYLGVTLTAQPGDEVISPLHFYRLQTKSYDSVDAARREAATSNNVIAAEARATVEGTAPTRVIPFDGYDIENHWTDRLVGSVRWWSFSTGPLRSTPLAKLEPPFTVGVTFGGGIAEQVGFTFGEHIHLLVPMIAASHHVALHVRRDGRFVLLRDGHPVPPTEFTGAFRVPERLGGVLHPQICVWNVDGHLQTQSPQLWLNTESESPDLSGIEHSIIIPSTRYSRRLQALLLAVAHQAQYDLRRIEVIVSYVPGLDSNDDLLDSIQSAFPALRIVRCTFSERHAKSRGLMVNEAVRMTAGKWVTLFDSDIVVPPDFYARLDAVPEGVKFVAPDGRKMLTPEATAQILLGERRPWEEFAAFMEGPGELWHREADEVPVGFCQIVRREILLEFPYAQADHFEGSDWHFSRQVLEKYGKEHRMENCYVLHLDHGGSQWFGVRKQK